MKDRSQLLKLYFPVAEAINMLLYPHGEVVIHDLFTRSIAAIYHPISKRKVGDPSLIKEIKYGAAVPDVFPLYTKVDANGKKYKCVTTTLRDLSNVPIGFLCINLDIAEWEHFRFFLDRWIGGTSTKETILFEDDWRDKIHEYTASYLREKNLSIEGLSAIERKALVSALYRARAFEVKNSAAYVAAVLQVSRATIYNDLKG